jgi:hypothetical protein
MINVQFVVEVMKICVSYLLYKQGSVTVAFAVLINISFLCTYIWSFVLVYLILADFLIYSQIFSLILDDFNRKAVEVTWGSTFEGFKKNNNTFHVSITKRNALLFQLWSQCIRWWIKVLLKCLLKCLHNDVALRESLQFR